MVAPLFVYLDWNPQADRVVSFEVVGLQSWFKSCVMLGSFDAFCIFFSPFWCFFAIVLSCHLPHLLKIAQGWFSFPSWWHSLWVLSHWYCRNAVLSGGNSWRWEMSAKKRTSARHWKSVPRKKSSTLRDVPQHVLGCYTLTRGYVLIC